MRHEDELLQNETGDDTQTWMCLLSLFNSSVDKSVAVYDAVSKNTLFSFAASANCDRGDFQTMNHSHSKHRDAKHSCFLSVFVRTLFTEPGNSAPHSETARQVNDPDLPPPCNLSSHQTNSRKSNPSVFGSKFVIFAWLVSLRSTGCVRWCNSIFSNAAFQTVIEVAPQVGTSRALWSAWKDLRYCTI